MAKNTKKQQVRDIMNDKTTSLTRAQSGQLNPLSFSMFNSQVSCSTVELFGEKPPVMPAHAQFKAAHVIRIVKCCPSTFETKSFLSS